jgi:hypothetical protein
MDFLVFWGQGRIGESPGGPGKCEKLLRHDPSGYRLNVSLTNRLRRLDDRPFLYMGKTVWQEPPTVHLRDGGACD